MLCMQHLGLAETSDFKKGAGQREHFIRILGDETKYEKKEKRDFQGAGRAEVAMRR